VAKLRNLGVTVTNLSQFKEGIRLNSNNASYHPVQSLIYCCLFSESVKIKIYPVFHIKGRP
jgi:hypothetical protein